LRLIEAVPKPFKSVVELVETTNLRSCWRFDISNYAAALSGRFDKLSDRSVLK
jgi:hypothetical protein